MGRAARHTAMLGRCIIVLLASLGARAFAADCSDRVDRASPLLANGYTGNLANTRAYASPITSAKVARLQLALSHAATGSGEKRGAPAVTQQAVFFAAGRELIAMNRLSGCRYWTYTIPQRRDANRQNALRSSSIYLLAERTDQPALLLAGDYFGHYYAVDAQSGALRWSRFVGTEADHHMVTGGSQFHDGKLLVPVASKEVLLTIHELLRLCCSSHGLLQALDAYTGETIWTYHSTADASYQPSSRRLAPNGASLWGTPAVDTRRRRVYVGTGQNLTPPATDNSDAIVALDFDSGAPLWVFQSTAGDAWNAGCELRPPLRSDCVEPAGHDFDIGAAPMLVVRSGRPDLLIAGGKNGVVYALDPDTGALQWQRKLGRGGTLGGVHWGMASDGTRLYVGINDVQLAKGSTPTLINRLLVKPSDPPPGETRPGVYALDLDGGAVLWEQHPTHLHEGVAQPSHYSAALSVTNDVVFAASLDGVVKAFRSGDGAELWSYDTAGDYVDVEGKPGNGGTIDSVGAIVAGGDVLVNSGYDSFGKAGPAQAGPGNMLLIFRLPEA